MLLAYCQAVKSSFNNSFWYEVSFSLFPFTIKQSGMFVCGFVGNVSAPLSAWVCACVCVCVCVSDGERRHHFQIIRHPSESEALFLWGFFW